jgi:putative DNA primase/helicase
MTDSTANSNGFALQNGHAAPSEEFLLHQAEQDLAGLLPHLEQSPLGVATYIVNHFPRIGWLKPQWLPYLAAIKDDPLFEAAIDRFEAMGGKPFLLKSAVAKYLKKHKPTGEAGRSTVNGAIGREYPYGDAFNAQRLVQIHGHVLRYCPAWKSWLVWTGTHWQRDVDSLVLRLCRETVKALGAHLPGMGETETNALIAHIKSSLNTGRLKAAVEQAPSFEGMTVATGSLDQDAWLLNCQNGTLDLHTGKLRSHRQDDLLTKCLPIAYDPSAQCPAWEAFLWRAMGGSLGPDTEDMGGGELENRRKADERAKALTGFLQRALGYTLTGHTTEQCLLLLHGMGSNGKSTFLEVLQILLGDYAQSTPSASLLAKDRHDGIPNDIARLRGARLVTAVEIGEGKRLDEELVKRLTGQDTLTARFLHGEFFDFKAEFKLFIACNHLPTIRGTDYAIWRRIRLIPFTVTIPDEEQDRDLPAKLRAELPGILHWAVQGCLDWQHKGLGAPVEVTEATADYRASMDVIGRFIEERCILSPKVRVKAGDIYQDYKRWCDEGNEYPMNQKNFGLRLSERGLEPQKGTAGARWWIGIGLQQAADSGVSGA